MLVIQLRRQASEDKHGVLWTNKQTRFVEIVLVADTSYYRDFGDDVYNRLRATANAVNAIYREIGIVVVLTDIEVWKDYDRTTVSSDVDITISSFAPYRQKLLKTKRGVNNDNTILVTTADFAGHIIGYGYVGGICTHDKSVAIVQDRKNKNIGPFSRTIAHELGHNLGMLHDEHGNENCCQETTCIMSGTESTMATQKVGWSSCSKELVKRKLDSVNFECLRNVPKNLYQKTCGNGVLEAGEQCDCGPPAFCDNGCCDAETCKLAANAMCSHGSCCNTETCHLHRPGRVCRENDGDCDLPEFCSGISEFCPADVHVRDGTPCERDKGYCYKGSCGNPDSRCKKMWDQSATEANPACLNVNQNGNDNGNCGWEDESRKSFRKCSEIDSSCGTLQCNVGNDVRPRVTGKITYVTGRIGSHNCKHILGNEDIPGNMWLAQDGTPCGRKGEGMCIQQKCRTVVKPDGATECPKNCSGRGVCNNKGHCHCSPGYGPPDCANRGHGGSYDSNYISDRSYEIAIDGFLLFLAIIIPIVAFICCSWEKIRLWWDHGGYSLWSSRCPNCATCINACCCPCMSKITYWCVTVGHKKETDLNPKEIQQVVDDTEALTVCQVMIDMKEQSLTNSWGVADERLFTEVVKFTPKKSPYSSRKIVIKSNSPVRHHRSVEDFDRVPPYQHQLVSVDSGYVSDDDVTVHQAVTSQMSMTSLIGVFSRFSNTSVKSNSNCCKNLNQRQKAFGSQKSIPLSRFDVDPLAGNHRSRKGTPPPNDIRNSFSRSISTSSMAMLHQRTTQPSFEALKPHKSDNNIHSISNNTNKNRWSLLGKTSNEYKNVQSKQKVHETGHQPEMQPMLPKQTNVGSSKAIRPAPLPPPQPKNKLQEHESKLLGQNKDSVNQKLPSNTKDTITPRRPIMPPKSSLSP
ncbi:disintegrin and metalloproteinase domain-containing protein 28-like [Palaemon carinicauda]|uniref:disintegrin and metalloproteinase domain-containing protein 28-like n=1 Tax=Palaemon carinicauda TaxID=392227 RepID=UPI0035B6294A